ncbi:hypothetical protein [Bremerella cremea]
MLGCWLLGSPFIFRGADRGDMPAIGDFVIGLLVIGFASLSFRQWPRFSHVGTLLLSAVMIFGPGIALTPHVPPAGENIMMTGLLLLLLSIVPNQTSAASHVWSSRLKAPRFKS